MDDAVWASGTINDLPVLSWQSQGRLRLVPTHRTLVVDLTEDNAPTPIGDVVAGATDEVDGVVARYLALGLALAGTPVDLAGLVMGSRWAISIESPARLVVIDPDGIPALTTSTLPSELAGWLGSIRSYGGCRLFTGTGLWDASGLVDLDRAERAGTLVHGWANLVS